MPAMDGAPLVLLDGPLGTELERRGLPLPAPMWSARALVEAPLLVSQIHAEYGAAGADVHTANTFRTTARALAGTDWAARWRGLLKLAVSLCRDAVPEGARVAGSLAPLEDCFSPALTPPDDALVREHGETARALADAGCDLLLVETMPTAKELRAATVAAVATGKPVWAGITLGPRGDFFDAAGVAAAAHVAADAGAQAFLINCTAPPLISRLLGTLSSGEAPAGLALGAYANTIFEGGAEWPPERYVEEAQRWRAAGASIIGGCCGTTPRHIAALRRDLSA
jgi:S-methylmethionine-dependent homocysteine/selenocysteine methylase